MPDAKASAYPVDARNRAKRRHDRGFYDHATVHALLDAAVLCHVSYVIDGLPYCTPTLFWREGTTLYWHGSSASRMLRNQSAGQPACLTITHLDSLVLARCGFNHSADYRSVMAFGNTRLVDEQAEKEAALVAMVDRLFPFRPELTEWASGTHRRTKCELRQLWGRCLGWHAAASIRRCFPTPRMARPRCSRRSG